MSRNCRILKCGSCEITQGYSSSHQAYDIVAKGYTLDYILAHSDGTVNYIQDGYENAKGSTGMASYGNMVKISHNNGYETLYAHFAKGLKVKNGQAVKKGDILGYMGNSGNSYGGHCHFEVRKNGSKISPNEYLDKDLPTSTVDYTGTITYQAYTNKWLPEVSKCDNTDNGYAGIGNSAICGYRCKPQYGELIYEAHINGGSWLSAVNSKDYANGGDNSYAGWYGRPIDMIRIKSTKGYVNYQVKTKEDGWLPMVDSKTTSGTESYAGIPGHTIIGIRMK